MTNILKDVQLKPPSLPNNRTSRFHKLKELEKEYFEFGQNPPPAKNINDTNPYIEREMNDVTKTMRMSNGQRGHSLDLKRNSRIF